MEQQKTSWSKKNQGRLGLRASEGGTYSASGRYRWAPGAIVASAQAKEKAELILCFSDSNKVAQVALFL